MEMARALELLDHLADYPQSSVILKAVHLKQGKPSRRFAELEEEDAFGQLGDIHAIVGGAREPIPAHLAEMANWADELRKKPN